MSKRFASVNDNYDDVEHQSPTSASLWPRSTATVRGRFRDSLLGCCNAGPFHPSLWLSGCFPALAAAQFVHRVQWIIPAPSPNFFARMVFVCGIYTILRLLCFTVLALRVIGQEFIDENDKTNVDELCQSASELDSFLWHLMWFLTGLWLWRLRWRTRQRDRIRGHCGIDLCCSFTCPGLVASQLLRHTADYKHVPGRCCTRTGLKG